MNAIHSTLLAVAVLFTIGVNASTLALSIEHHAAVATNGQKRTPFGHASPTSR